MGQSVRPDERECKATKIGIYAAMESAPQDESSEEGKDDIQTAIRKMREEREVQN